MLSDTHRLQRHEDDLTVVKGCVTTLLNNWERLTEGDRQVLLQAALRKTEDLVLLYEEDVATFEAG